MAKSLGKVTISSLIVEIDKKLKKLDSDLAGLSLRDKVKRLVLIRTDVQKLGVAVVRDAGIDERGARDRIRLYLCEYVGQVIEGKELAVVSGISEYARRIRELRKEQGYHIISGASPDPDAGVELKPAQYVLVSKTPDLDSARRWHIANRIRRSGGGSQDRVLRYLQENVGKVVTTEELAYVARDAKEFGRRVRELRTEQGFSIATRFTGRPDLKSGQYVLQSLERVAQEHDRHIEADVLKEVYERDRNTCVQCGWDHTKQRPDDFRFLEVHHLQHHAKGGQNVKENLVLLCNRCHDDVHAKRIELRPRG